MPNRVSGESEYLYGVERDEFIHFSHICLRKLRRLLRDSYADTSQSAFKAQVQSFSLFYDDGGVARDCY